MFNIQVSIDAVGVLLSLQNLEVGIGQTYYLADNALRDGMQTMVDRAKELAPVDTGRLRDSIRFEGGEGEYTFIADPKNPTSGLRYAVYPEYGTSRQIEQPYMRPALGETLQQVVERIKNDLINIMIGAGQGG